MMCHLGIFAADDPDETIAVHFPAGTTMQIPTNIDKNQGPTKKR